MEDSRIIELFFDRSEQAIAELARKYGSLCRSIAFRILNNREDAEECVNDTWLGAWNRIPPETPDPLAAYICRITRNLSLKKYRYNTAKYRNSFYDISLSELEECVPASEEGTEPSEEENLEAVIEEFLDSLDKKSRVMFVKRYWYAENLKTIAGEMGVTENHAAVRLLRIRRKLKTYLERRGVCL